MDKVGTLADLVSRYGRATSVCFGGGGMVRKPMAAAAAIGLSNEGPRRFVSVLGGPELDLLIGRGKVARLQFAYLGLDSLGLAPNFRATREKGQLDIIESSEYLILAGLEAAARRIPFMPTRSGLGTDVLTRANSPYRTFPCPLTGEQLVAVQALAPDLAVVHVNVADRRGNALIYGEVFADFLIARATRSLWITAERVVGRLPPMDQRPSGTFIPRLLVEGVVPSPGGADFTGIYPDYFPDFDAGEVYRDNASDPSWLEAYAKKLIDIAPEPINHVA